MLRKLIGTGLTLLAIGCATFFVFAVGDLLTGGSPETSAGVLAGLAVFFGGLTATSGFGAFRMLTTQGTGARTRSPEEYARDRATMGAARNSVDKGVDIALEARLLAHAARHEGRVTVAEVAVSCAVSLDQAERALDELTKRGHADLHITPEGERVYVVKGFLSDAEKQEAQDVVEATRS